ncbi:MAG: mannose-1-phosphate guanylyltransferase/mannose-6-phosphate isomerase [Hydrogenimonas sp.]|nr:mannose-1-phosphate guanylyltransferase/mannose-6-phosphate isomerase [Hydrogenimonas sp.]
MTNIILCGGSGTRLWPISRTLMPKQFVKLFDERSLFQQTVERNKRVCDNQFIVSNAEQYFLAVDQLEEIGIERNRFLLEPIGRNTAPAIALACMALEPEEVVLVTPSDHLIKKEGAYFEAVKKAKELAKEGKLVTFGIEPTYPETGFGYIEADGFDVISFKEKPDLKRAENYLLENEKRKNKNESLKYFWNSGMFCFRADAFLKELQVHSPEIFEYSQKAYESAKTDNGLIRIKHEDMQAIPEESIDYAVMEKSDNVKVVPCDIGWSDLGSFDALYEELPKDENGNTLHENHISVGSKNNLIIGSDRTIATIDIEDMMIVDTGDALLISRKGSSQKVKQIVSELKQIGSQLPTIHLTAHRPWGTYTVLEDTPGYKIKRIVVKPGKRLSLQKHFHRSEHWVVVSGTATVTVGDETKLIRPNESTYIKIGEVHRLANNGKIPVVLIEAQVGEYTGEDDIVRLDDDFKRD